MKQVGSNFSFWKTKTFQISSACVSTFIAFISRLLWLIHFHFFDIFCKFGIFCSVLLCTSSTIWQTQSICITFFGFYTLKPILKLKLWKQPFLQFFSEWFCTKGVQCFLLCKQFLTLVCQKGCISIDQCKFGQGSNGSLNLNMFFFFFFRKFISS